MDEFDRAIGEAYDGYPGHLIAYIISPTKELTQDDRESLGHFLYLLFEQYGRGQ